MIDLVSYWEPFLGPVSVGTVGAALVLFFGLFIVGFPLVKLAARSRRMWLTQHLLTGLPRLDPNWTVGSEGDTVRAKIVERGRGVVVRCGVIGDSGSDRIDMQVDALPRSFGLRPEGAVEAVAKWFAGEDELLGDPGFDAAALVRGDEADITAFLNSDARAVILEMFRMNIRWEERSLVFEKWTDFKALAEITKTIELMHRVADCFGEPDQPREAKLLANLRTESLPEVRARNLAMLALHHGDSSQLDEGLREVLGEAPVQEEALLAELSSSPERAVAAAIVLGRTGTAVAVPALREWIAQHGSGLGFLARVGSAAVASIQERVGPVEGGALSVAEGTVGALSEAEGQGGELSVAEQEALRKKQAALKNRQG